MSVLLAAGPMVVALLVLGLAPVVMALRRRWSWTAVTLWLMGLGLLVTWTAKSIAIADSSFDNPPAWPAPEWMIAAIVVAAAAVLAGARARRSW